MKITPAHRSPRAQGNRIVVTIASLSVLLAGLAGSATASAASGHSPAGLVISTLTTKNFGEILQSTRTVYTLTPSKIACTAKCLSYWPEVLLPKGSTKVTAGRGVSVAKIGTIKRAGGRLQVTYGGRPLYWFVLDTAPGQVRGNESDTWGKWSVVVVKPANGGVSTPTTTSTSTSTATAGGGAGGIGF
ncbi:MAG: hypothetical protein HKL85_04285 [Acidimicrobiaceae bacterium]|nr:hypothetical protein [Acidimicrobiaceae bacterium]